MDTKPQTRQCLRQRNINNNGKNMLERNGNRLLHFVLNYQREADRIMLVTTLVAWALSFLYAFYNNTWLLALVFGGLLTGVNLCAIRLIKHRVWTSRIIAVTFMLFVTLQVHQLGGMIEAHFGYFVLLGVLFTYLSWQPLIWAAATAAVVHVTLHLLQHHGYPIYLFPEGSHSWSIVALHAFYVVMETTALLLMVRIVRPLLAVAQVIVEATRAILGHNNRLNLRVRANADGNP